MFKIEIHTLAGPYMATVPDDCKDPIQWAGDLIINGHAITLDDGSLWKAWNPDHIVGLLVYPNTDGRPEESPTAAAPEQDRGKLDPKTGGTGIVHVHRERIVYLGQACSIVMLLAWDSKSRAYFMPYRIENIPAAQYLNPKNFKGIVDAWLEQTYGGYTGEYEVIIPHGVVDTLEEAQEYVRDYIKETAPERKPAEKTGKAWQGFAEDRGQA